MKAIYDIWFLANNYKFKLENLSQAIPHTFKNRGTDIGMRDVVFSEKYKSDSEKQKQWQAFIQRTHLDVVFTFSEIIGHLYDFLDPAIDNKTKNAKRKWNPLKWFWED
jgi:hypothetical protein